MERSHSQQNAATRIVEILQIAGYEAVFAGGCVRDMIMEKEPEDYDIATNATPDKVKDIFPGSDLVGESFGVVIVKIKDLGYSFEVATYRQDGEYKDGRRPEDVKFVLSKEEDAARRDFTINAMFYDPISKQIYDYFDGQKDLKQGLIRFVGDPNKRIKEDKLRMLRAIRFAARFSFDFDTLSFESIKYHAPSILDIAGERIGVEFNKAFEQCDARGRRSFIAAMLESNLLKVLLPEVISMIGCEQSPEHHPEGDVWIHTLQVLFYLPDDASAELCWAGLLHDVGKPPMQVWDPVDVRWRFNSHDSTGKDMTKVILERFKYSNDFIEHVANLVGGHMKFIFVRQMRLSKFKRFLAQDRFGDHLHLHRADCLSSHGKLTNWEICIAEAEKLMDEGIQVNKLPDRLVTGNDLIELGFNPSPEFKPILENALDMQLEGSTREEILEFIKNLPR